MAKIFTADELMTKTLLELSALFNQHASAPRKAVFSCSKRKAIDKVLEVLPEAEEAKPKADSKVGRLIRGLTYGSVTAEELMELTGFDKHNLGVSISILRRKGNDIRFDKAAKTYTLHD